MSANRFSDFSMDELRILSSGLALVQEDAKASDADRDTAAELSNQIDAQWGYRQIRTGPLGVTDIPRGAFPAGDA